MSFPKKEAATVLAWMQDQMNGDTPTKWTHGDERDRMADCADFIRALVESESAEKHIQALFNELVPASGKADTVAGEIIRAVSRIAYRNWNDGDHIGVGYGKETCNPAARYLMARAGDDVSRAVEAAWGIYGDDLYDEKVADLEEAVLSYIEQHPELKTIANSEDMRDFRNEYEDVEDYEEDEGSEEDWC